MIFRNKASQRNSQDYQSTGLMIPVISRPVFVLAWNNLTSRFPIQKPFRAPHIAHQLGEAVLVEIDNHHALGLETKDGLDEAGTYRPGPTNDTDLPALDFLRQLLLVRLNIGGEHTDGAEGDVRGDELGEVKHILILNSKLLSLDENAEFLGRVIDGDGGGGKGHFRIVCYCWFSLACFAYLTIGCFCKIHRPSAYHRWAEAAC